MFRFGWSYQHAYKIQVNIIKGKYTLESDTHASVYKTYSNMKPSVCSTLILVYI